MKFQQLPGEQLIGSDDVNLILGSGFRLFVIQLRSKQFSSRKLSSWSFHDKKTSPLGLAAAILNLSCTGACIIIRPSLSRREVVFGKEKDSVPPKGTEKVTIYQSGDGDVSSPKVLLGRVMSSSIMGGGITAARRDDKTMDGGMVILERLVRWIEYPSLYSTSNHNMTL